MASQLKCRIGDLAVVIDAFNKCNIGRIVHVVGRCTSDSPLPPSFGSLSNCDWLVQCPTLLTWDIDGKRLRRKRGPVPDFALQPIRGGGKHQQEQQQQEPEYQQGECPERDEDVVLAEVF